MPSSRATVKSQPGRDSALALPKGMQVPRDVEGHRTKYGSAEARERHGSILPEVSREAGDGGPRAHHDEEREAGHHRNVPRLQHEDVQDRQGASSRLAAPNLERTNSAPPSGGAAAFWRPMANTEGAARLARGLRTWLRHRSRSSSHSQFEQCRDSGVWRRREPPHGHQRAGDERGSTYQLEHHPARFCDGSRQHAPR